MSGYDYSSGRFTNPYGGGSNGGGGSSGIATGSNPFNTQRQPTNYPSNGAGTTNINAITNSAHSSPLYDYVPPTTTNANSNNARTAATTSGGVSTPNSLSGAGSGLVFGNRSDPFGVLGGALNQTQQQFSPNTPSYQYNGGGGVGGSGNVPQTNYSSPYNAAPTTSASAPTTSAAAASHYYYDKDAAFNSIDKSGIRLRFSRRTAASPAPQPMTPQELQQYQQHPPSSSLASSSSHLPIVSADFIINFKTPLSAPPPADVSSRECEVYVDLMALRDAQMASQRDGGWCRGVVPTLALKKDSAEGVYRKHWVPALKGLRFVEMDIDVPLSAGDSTASLFGGGGGSSSHTASGGVIIPRLGLGGGGGGSSTTAAAAPTRHHVLRGTIVGCYGSQNTSDIYSPVAGRVVVWQPRGHEVCSPLDLSRARALTCIRCKHCAAIVPQDESAYHLEVFHPERAAAAKQQSAGGGMTPRAGVSAGSTMNTPRQTNGGMGGGASSSQPPLQQPRPMLGGGGGGTISRGNTPSSAGTAAFDPFTSPPVSGGGNNTANNQQQQHHVAAFGAFSSPTGAPPPLNPGYNRTSSTTGYGNGTAADPFVLGGGTNNGAATHTPNRITPSSPTPPAAAATSTNSNSSNAIPFGATQGTTYASYFGSAGGGGGGGNSPAAGPLSFGGATAGAGAASSCRSYTVKYSFGGRVLNVQRKSSEVFGSEYNRFQSLTRSTKLGEGAQGTVSLCQSPEGHHFVVKDLEFPTYEAAITFFKQSMKFASLRHVHLISYLAGEWGMQTAVISGGVGGATAVSDFLCDPPSASSPASNNTITTYYVSILMPFYPDGDVAKLIAHGSRLEWLAISSLGLQIATALHFLHTLPTPIIHGDIKPDNVLLYSNKEQCVLMDLDTASECHAHHHQSSASQLQSSVVASYYNRGGSVPTPNNSTGSNNANQPRGTMEWMSPEANDGKKVTTRSDIWSLGLTLFAMITLPEYMLFENPSTRNFSVLNDKDWTRQALETVLWRELDKAKCPESLAQMIMKMVVLNPEQRASASEVVVGLQNASEHILMGL